MTGSGGAGVVPAQSPGFRAELPVAGRRVLVVGSGAPALGTIGSLLAGGALVTAVGATPLPALTDLADRGLLTLWARPLRPDDVLGAWIVVAATADAAEQRLAAEVADSAGLVCIPVPVETTGRSLVAGAGRVVLVGAGPGDPGLLTVAGRAALRSADVVVTDRLAPLSALTEMRSDATVVDVSKIPHGASTEQQEINRLLVEHATAGATVVRFKGGDNFVFGRGGEEVEACVAAGVPVDVIPGVTSAIAGPALAGIPVTHRGLNQGFTVVSGHVAPDDPRCTLDYTALARAGTDLVLLMAVRTLPAIARALLAAGMAAATPAATVADAGLPSQRVLRGRLDDIAAKVAAAGVRSPAVTVIGAVAGFDPAAEGPAGA